MLVLRQIVVHVEMTYSRSGAAYLNIRLFPSRSPGAPPPRLTAAPKRPWRRVIVVSDRVPLREDRALPN